jgi:hypothetical protein
MNRVFVLRLIVPRSVRSAVTKLASIDQIDHPYLACPPFCIATRTCTLVVAVGNISKQNSIQLWRNQKFCGSPPPPPPYVGLEISLRRIRASVCPWWRYQKFRERRGVVRYVCGRVVVIAPVFAFERSRVHFSVRRPAALTCLFGFSRRTRLGWYLFQNFGRFKVWTFLFCTYSSLYY